MRAVAQISLIVLTLVAAAANIQAQSSDQETKEGTGVITGRVMASGKPAVGFVVTLEHIDPKRDNSIMVTFQRAPQVKALTDQEGRYRLMGLQAGRYTVSPFAPAHILKPDAATRNQHIPIILAEGETVEGIDFALERGGVITGRVTKADGRPVIGESVTFSGPILDDKTGPTKIESRDEDQEDDEDDDDDEGGQDMAARSTNGGEEFKTDDRGYYRIYGLPQGRYLLSVGASGRPIEAKRRYHETTYHPGVTDITKANYVEVTPGGEVNADIKLGTPSLTFRASGRVIDGETGKPLANAIIIAATGGNSEPGIISSMTQPGLTNDKGEFRIESLTEGKYAALARFGLDGQSEFYTDKVDFEIKGGDVTGLIIKAHRGLVVSGVAVVEGASDATAVNGLSQIELIAFVTSDETQAPSYSSSKINPDGSFQFRGLRPGKAKIMPRFFSAERKLSLTRIERGGIDQKDSIEIAPGQQVTDLRVVLTYASASIRGQVKVEGGAVEKGSYLMVTAFHANGYEASGTPEAEVDANGQFILEGLIPGEYRLMLTHVPPPSKKNAQPQRVNQSVIVTPNAETQVTIVLNLSKKERDR